MTTDKQKYRFCTTNDNETMEPLETTEYEYNEKSTIFCLRNKNTGMVCYPSTYSKPYRQGTLSAYEFDDDVFKDGHHVINGKIAKFTRQNVSLKSSDSDVTRGIKLVIDANRTTDDDWEVVKFSNVNREADHPLVEFDCVKMPYISGYNGTGKYRTYDCSLYDIPRDILALFKDGEVIESNDWADGEDVTDSYRASNIPNLEVI